ncbi:MAG: sigma 54-interacting transcriptional regulator [Phycisphaeraceae bacterium]|nr:sigma 54-interacting transcriptional regulator [Phycisphaeraceae bacterium]
MDRARELLLLAAGFPSTVLLHGESGTGKELAARAIHELSPRSAAPFVTVDCTVLTETLFESILFGHERGSFSGAIASTTGLVRAADGGTLFLDEIGELPAPEQAKLLRLLQERTVLPVGGTRPIPVDVRVVAATHRDLPAMVLDGRFRADLYYRLDVVRITLPSLRDHASDIPLIAAAILRRLNTLLGVSRALSPAAVDTLMLHAWPGNVRQLAACLERAAVTCRGDTIEPRDLGLPHLEPVISTQPLLKRSAAEAVRFALAEANGNRAAAARRLGIGRAQLYRMIDRFGIDATPSTNGEA